jgi:DNA replication licensing factor MCM6
MQIRGEGLADEQGQGPQGEQHRVVYVLHPMCPVEDMV